MFYPITDLLSPMFWGVYPAAPSSSELPTAAIQEQDKAVTEVATAATAQTQAVISSPKKHIWRTLSDGLSAPFISVARKVAAAWASVKESWTSAADVMVELFEWLFEDEDVVVDPVTAHKNSRKNEEAQNNDAIKRFSEQIKKIQENTTNANQLISSFDVSSPEKLLKWLQIPENFSTVSSPSAIEAAIGTKIAAFTQHKERLTATQSTPAAITTDKLTPEQLENEQNSKKKADIDARFLTVLENQIYQLEQLQKEVINLVPAKESESKEKEESASKEESSSQVEINPIVNQWYAQFEQNKAAISATFNQMQQKTLVDLKKLERDKSVKTQGDLKFYLEYFNVYFALEKCQLLDKLGVDGVNHLEIERISGSLAVGFEQGIVNLRNTCWLNSGLQAMRKSPKIMALLRTKLVRMANEDNAHFAERERIQGKLIAAFGALDFGDANKIEKAVKELIKALLDSKGSPNGIVPIELTQNEGIQKDPTDLIRCVFNVINYRVPCSSIQTVEGTAQVSDDPDGLGFLAVFPTRGKSFEELIDGAILPENVQGYRNKDGKVVPCMKERKLKGDAPLPEVFITAVQRLAGDPVRAAELTDVRNRIRDAFPDRPLTPQQLNDAAAIIYGASWNQLNGKNDDPVSITFDAVNRNYILDLTNSALTSTLPKVQDPDGNEGRQPLRYRLVSVINHQGGINGGHYVACGMRPDAVKGQADFWTHMNDTNVGSLNEQAAAAQIKQGYVFIWERYTGDVVFPNKEADVKVAQENEVAKEIDEKAVKESEEAAKAAIADNGDVVVDEPLVEENVF